MTPFDVLKTRLQTQPPKLRAQLGGTIARDLSTLAYSPVSGVMEKTVARSERVNNIYDAVRHVWKAERVAGFWKGVGTAMLVPSLVRKE